MASARSSQQDLVNRRQSTDDRAISTNKLLNRSAVVFCLWSMVYGFMLNFFHANIYIALTLCQHFVCNVLGHRLYVHVFSDP